MSDEKDRVSAIASSEDLAFAKRTTETQEALMNATDAASKRVLLLQSLDLLEEIILTSSPLSPLLARLVSAIVAHAREEISKA